MNSRLLYFVSAFLCGAVVMGVELSASRLMAPYFGASLYVWTNVIAVILLALAGGYAFGGWLADRHPKPELYFGLIGLTGLWILAIPFFSGPLSLLFMQVSPSLASAVRVGSLLVMLLLFLSPLFVLGMVVPFTLKLLAKDLKHVASLSGRLSMVSTFGSLIGTFLPTFVLIPLLGTTRTFLFLGFVLIFLSVWGLRKALFFILALGLLILFWFVPAVYASPAIIASKDSSYGFLFVTEDEEGVRRLHIDTPLGTQSIYDPSSTLLDTAYYYTYFAALPALIEQPQRVLILGHAGGSFTRLFNAFYPELHVTGVELDPAVTEIAEATLGLENAQVNIVHGDARTFLEKDTETYDLILVDAYHGTSIPAHLATQEFFALCATHLTEEGVLALNAASIESPFLSTLANTLAQPFGTVFKADIPNSFNALLMTRANGDYSPHADLDPTLTERWDLLQNVSVSDHDQKADEFLDDRLSEVELLNEDMFMRLLGEF